MILYFNGDSFVQGCELGDDILPGYPGLTPYPMNSHDPKSVQSINKEWLAKTYNPKHEYSSMRNNLYHEISKLEYERAFPNKVGKLMGCETINHALGGSSMDRIVRTSLCDLKSLRKENPTEPVIAFVGTTHPMRWEMPKSFSDIHFDIHGQPKDWQCISTTYRTSEEDYLREEMIKLRVLTETNYHALVSFYKNILLLQNFCALNNIHLYWVATHDNILTSFPIEYQYENRQDLKLLKEAADLFYKIDMVEVIEDRFSWHPVLCPGGHFGESVHVEVAHIIVKIIEELNL